MGWGWRRAAAGEGEGSRFGTRGVKTVGNALGLMAAWRRRDTVWGHRGCLKLSTKQSLSLLKTCLVKPEPTPESGTYLS